MDQGLYIARGHDEGELARVISNVLASRSPLLTRESHPEHICNDQTKQLRDGSILWLECIDSPKDLELRLSTMLLQTL
jgi:hypothetical protein